MLPNNLTPSKECSTIESPHQLSAGHSCAALAKETARCGDGSGDSGSQRLQRWRRTRARPLARRSPARAAARLPAIPALARSPARPPMARLPARPPIARLCASQLAKWSAQQARYICFPRAPYRILASIPYVSGIISWVPSLFLLILY